MKENKGRKAFSEQGECSLCHNIKPIYNRRHSGQNLCKDCFISSIEKIINKTISKYDLLTPIDKIVVGVSGGKDSITLLYNLKQIQEKTYNAKPLSAISIDEGIENYSSTRLNIVKETCKELNVELKVVSFKEYTTKTLDQIVAIQEKHESFRYPCNYCATIKRRILNDLAKELEGTVLALGHNLTDVSETYLMNILYNRLHLIARGNILRKSSNLTDKYIDRVFPLMKIPEHEIELYVNLKKLKYYGPLCPFRKEHPILRKRVLHFLNELKKTSPEIEFNLFNGSLELLSVLGEKYKETAPHYCPKCGYPTPSPTKCRYCSLLEALI